MQTNNLIMSAVKRALSIHNVVGAPTEVLNGKSMEIWVLWNTSATKPRMLGAFRFANNQAEFENHVSGRNPAIWRAPNGAMDSVLQLSNWMHNTIALSNTYAKVGAHHPTLDVNFDIK